MNNDSHRSFLKQVIIENVFVTKEQERIVQPNGSDGNWLFDFRRILLKPEVLEAIGEHFFNTYKERTPFQIGGVEVAAIPLITGLCMILHRHNLKANGFFLRKSRKKSGLLRMIEGELDDTPVVLVDDLINTGSSLLRQVEILEKLGKRVQSIFVVLRFRDLNFYNHFTSRGIEIQSLFTLDDFSEILGLENLKPNPPQLDNSFRVRWYFKSDNPDYYAVREKSTAVSDAKKIYFGSDDGIFWALNHEDGSVAWKFQIPSLQKRRGIFSSPALYQNTLFFGAQDGNFYALDATDGRQKWVSFEADCITSSPCIAPNLDMVYVGLQYGWWKKNGSLMALDSKSGKVLWSYEIPNHVIASPAYSTKCSIIVCGANDSHAYAFNARTGELLWKFTCKGILIGKPIFDENKKRVIFGSMDGDLYILHIKNGVLIRKIPCEAGIASAPFLVGNKIYVASLDKTLYCFEADTGLTVWKFKTGARIFSSPVVVDNSLYIGNNDSRLYVLDISSGQVIGQFQATERITNPVTFDFETGHIFLQTFANEVYCLEKI